MNNHRFSSYKSSVTCTGCRLLSNLKSSTKINEK